MNRTLTTLLVTLVTCLFLIVWDFKSFAVRSTARTLNAGVSTVPEPAGPDPPEARAGIWSWPLETDDAFRPHSYDAEVPPASEDTYAQSFIVEVVDGTSACRQASAAERASSIPRDNDPRTPVKNFTSTGRSLIYGSTSASPAAEDSSTGLVINLITLSQLEADPNRAVIVDAFRRAANTWKNRIKTPISISLNIDYGVNMPDGNRFPYITLGTTNTFFIKTYYPAVRRNLIASAANPAEAALYGALPLTAVPTDTGVADFVFVPKSLSHALGLSASSPSDEAVATISFNKNIAFDFNPDDGIDEGEWDFVAVCTHEIGHALGFTSSAASGEPPSVWDIFRFRPGVSVDTFSSAPRITTVGGEQIYFTGQTFTVNGVQTTALPLSTGGQHPTDGVGDGQHSGHWKDDDVPGQDYIGIMDPTLGRSDITENDFSAAETIGWNLVSNAPPPPPAPVQNDGTSVDLNEHGNPTQTLGTRLSGPFSSLEVKYEGSCRSNLHQYALVLIEAPDSRYADTTGGPVRTFSSFTRRVSSRCGPQTDLWTASDFSSTTVFDPHKFYAFMLAQLDARPYGSEQDVYPQGSYNTQDAQSTNLRDLYFVLALTPPPAPPAVSLLKPTAAAVGGKVIINGSGFGAIQSSGFVTFGSAAAGIHSWSDTQITAFAPAGPGETAPVTVTTPRGASNAEEFTYIPPPAACGSIISQQSGIDLCGEGLDVPSDCGSWGGESPQVHKFAQVFTSQITASPGKLALKISGFFGNPSSSVGFRAHLHSVSDPNGANESNLLASSTGTHNVHTSQEGQNIVLTFDDSAPQLLQGQTYTWILEATGGNVGSVGLKGSNENDNDPGGVAYLWHQGTYATGPNLTGNNSSVPKYYYFALCGQSPNPTPTPALTNVALAANGATAAASSFLNQTRAPFAAINGDRRGLHWGSDPATGSGWHDSTQNAFPDSLEITFAGPRTIHEVHIFSVQDNVNAPSAPTDTLTFTKYGVTHFQIEQWNGSAWQLVPGATVNGNNKVWVKLTLAPFSTTKIRVVVNHGLAGYSRLAEFEAWGESGPAPTPSPIPTPTPSPTRMNHALASNGATVIASTFLDAGRAPLAAINGDRRGRHWGTDPATGSGWHDLTNNSFPDSLEIAFNGQKTISEVNVFTVQNNYTSPSEPTESMTFTLYGLQDFDVEYWTGSGWAVVPGGQVTGNNLVWRNFAFPALSTNRIRVLVKRGAAGYSRITEVEAF
jgi:hypothetical protein